MYDDGTLGWDAGGQNGLGYRNGRRDGTSPGSKAASAEYAARQWGGGAAQRGRAAGRKGDNCWCGEAKRPRLSCRGLRWGRWRGECAAVAAFSPRSAARGRGCSEAIRAPPLFVSCVWPTRRAACSGCRRNRRCSSPRAHRRDERAPPRGARYHRHSCRCSTPCRGCGSRLPAPLR